MSNSAKFLYFLVKQQMKEHENSDHAKTTNAFIGRIEKFLAERNAKAGDDGPTISLSYGHTALYSNSDIVEALVEADKNMYLDKAARKKTGN